MVDFLGIGVQKGGTSWLYQNLARHPDVWLPFVKEVHFFDRHLMSRKALDRARRSGDFEDLRIVRAVRLRIRKLREGTLVSAFGNKVEIAYLKRLVERDFFLTDEWYDFLFSPASPEMKTGEITPFYCAMGEPRVTEVKRRYPAARMIYLIRDPVDRALSCFRMLGRRLAVDMKDARALAAFADHCLGSNDFYKRGDFRSNIPRWDRHFGDQVLYLPFGQIKSDPRRLLRQIESFIGIRPFEDYPALHETVHATYKTAPIPDEIRCRFAAANADQYRFLADRFPPDFVARLR